MSNNDIEHSLMPTRKGVSWPLITKIVVWSLPFLAAAALAYAKAQFTTHEDFSALTTTVSVNASATDLRVHSLEEYRIRDDALSTQLGVVLRNIGEEQAAQKSLLKTIQSSQDRMLNRLDTISDRQIRNTELFSK